MSQVENNKFRVTSIFNPQRLAQEIFQQDTDSKTHTPMQVIPPKTDTGQPEGQLYSQYISTVRAQITCAKEIRDLLHDGLKLSSDHPHP